MPLASREADSTPDPQKLMVADCRSGRRICGATKTKCALLEERADGRRLRRRGIPAAAGPLPRRRRAVARLRLGAASAAAAGLPRAPRLPRGPGLLRAARRPRVPARLLIAVCPRLGAAVAPFLIAAIVLPLAVLAGFCL